MRGSHVARYAQQHPILSLGPAPQSLTLKAKKARVTKHPTHQRSASIRFGVLYTAEVSIYLSRIASHNLSLFNFSRLSEFESYSQSIAYYSQLSADRVDRFSNRNEAQLNHTASDRTYHAPPCRQCQMPDPKVLRKSMVLPRISWR